jgi:hypothetical protein
MNKLGSHPGFSLEFVDLFSCGNLFSGRNGVPSVQIHETNRPAPQFVGLGWDV